MAIWSKSGRNYICCKWDDNLCGGGSVSTCVIRRQRVKNVEGKWEQLKGVLIRKWCGVNNCSGKLYKIEQDRIDFVDKLKWKWGVWFGNGITVALHNGSGVARHKQRWNGREHNS